ncbi:MAG: hypothetical protein JWO78_1984 [Micavibrio sp.]|nr:hypothetical protein [Micavibrio sp.]
MGKVVSIDRIRQMRREGFLASTGDGNDDGDGTDRGPSPTEFAALMDLFQLARDGGLVSKVSILPTDDGFLFRAYSLADPYYALFEIQKVRTGKWFEYQGRSRHQLIAVDMGFFHFMDTMRGEVERLVSMFGT